MTPETLSQLAIAVPLIGSVFILLAGKWPNLREAVTLTTAVIMFTTVASITPAVLAGARPDVVLWEILPGLAIRLTIEPLGMLFGLVSSGLWIINSVYSIGYMRGNREAHQTRFYFFFAIALASAAGVAFSGNMLTLFIFYEVLTLSTYPLVAHHGDPATMRSARTYVGILLSTSIGLLLFGMIWTWQLTGTLDFKQGGILEGKVDGDHGGRPAGALHVRHRQGGPDAGSPLAAGGDGRADPGERAAACGGRGEGRRLHRAQGRGLHLRL